MDSKELIGLTLDYWKYLLDENRCGVQDLNAFVDVASKELSTMGTVKDFARFFGKPESQVRNIIHYKVTDKPVRRVFYHFHPFVKNIPKSWLKTK